MKTFFIDLHCHPDLKPYGQSFANTPVGNNTTDASDPSSIWHRTPPNDFSRVVQDILGIARFTQSDFQTLVIGNCKLICASLYPIEQGFFRNKLGEGIVGKIVDSFITGAGTERVAYIQQMNNYFEDLQNEYKYYLQLHQQTVSINGSDYVYILVKNYDDVTNYLNANPRADNVLFVIVTIEGLHVLNTNISGTPAEADFLANLDTIKQWDFAPFFITFCHHFYNQLCGHAQSLFGIVHDATDQSDHINTSFTPLGIKVLHALLDNSGGRKRIIPDIKHMSAQGRKDYFNILATNYAGDPIPLIVSHGAANGRRSMDEPNAIDGFIGDKLLPNDINMYDNEIVLVAQSGGIFGLQMDEHRLASKETISMLNEGLSLQDTRNIRAELVWNQVQHIAELLDKNGLDAWGCMALGTDSDGIINPINGFLTLETLPDLFDAVWQYADDYMNGRGKDVLQSANQIDIQTLMNNVFYLNAQKFLQKWFK